MNQNNASLAPLAAVPMAPPSQAEAATPSEAPPAGPAAADPMLPFAMPGDVFSAVCSVRGEGGTYPLASQVGLPEGMCSAWSALTDIQREACVHTFSAANTSELEPLRAQLCASSVSGALGMTATEMVDCVRAPNMPHQVCMSSLRVPLVLAENEPMSRQLDREASRRSEAVTGDSEAIGRIRTLIGKDAPTREDVYSLVSLCRWDRGLPTDARANEILAETYLNLPAGERAICNEANAFCGNMESVANMCHAIQHKVGTNAYVAKVEDFYAAGEYSVADQRLAMTMQLYPEPYGSAFMEMAVACNVDRTQADVARSLLAQSRGDVVRNREICRRIDEGVGMLPRMDHDMAALSALMAGGAKKRQ
jgi:hypothetical protein